MQGVSGEAYQAVRTKVDANGAAHVRYTRTYQGLRVYGGDFVVHTARRRRLRRHSVGLARPADPSAPPRRSPPAKAAQAGAQARFSGTITAVGAPELFVDASTGKGRLAWETVRHGWAADEQTPSQLHVITDAATGAYIGSFDEIETVAGTGNGIYTGTVSIDTTLSGSTYQMIDPSHGNGRTCDMNNGTVDLHARSPTPTTCGATAPTPTGSPPASTRTSAPPRRSTTTRTCTAATASSATARACRAGCTTAALRQRVLGRRADDLRRRRRQRPPAGRRSTSPATR